MTKTKRRILSAVFIGIALAAFLSFGFCFGNGTKVSAATMPKYTVALTGTVTKTSWGGSHTTDVKDQTKISVQKYNTSGQTEDIILYLTGSSTSGTATLHDGGYVASSKLNFSTTLSKDTLTLTTSEGKEVAKGTGSLSASVSDGKYIIKLNHFKESGAGYTMWKMNVNVSCSFFVDTKAPTISGASTSTTGKYTNAAFTVRASDTGSGIKALYMKAPGASSYTQLSGTSKTISKGSTNGRYAFYAKDNCNNNSATYYVNFDDSAPTLSVSGASFGGTVAQGFTVTAKDSNTVTLYYKYETDSWKSVGTSYTVEDDAKDGVHYFYAEDKLGNRSEEYWVRFMAAEPVGEFIKSNTDNTVYFTWEGNYWTATLDGKSYTKGTWIKTEGKHTIILSNGAGKSTSYPFSIEHYFVKGETVPPTCSEQGYTEYKCSQCGETKKEDYVEAIGHSYKMTTKPPTCTEMGETVYTCEVCGFEYKEEGEYPSGHSYTATVVKSPSCTEDGQRNYHCDKCGYEYTASIPATGHDYSITDEQNEDGSTKRVYTCANCGDTYTQDLGNQTEMVTNYVEYLFEQYSPYMIWVFLATAGVWSIFMGIVIIIAHKHEEKEKAKRMLVNYLIGLVVIFGILVAAPYVVRGIAALVT